MRKSIQAELARINDVEFRELEMRISIASRMRMFMQKFNLDAKTVALKLGFPHLKLIQICNGAHDLDLRDVACLQAVQADYEIERVKDEVKGMVGFASYKDQVPLQYRNLIEALEKMQGADKAEITLAFPNFRRTFRTAADPAPNANTLRK